MRLAERILNLGTETAFQVSAEAREEAAKGVKVYPFHLGDMNLPTPETVVQGMEKAIQEGKTGYCPNPGIPELREALAAEVGRSRNIDLDAENVSIQPGGKPVISKFILSLMNPGDEVLYPNPGYPIYESQIEFFGGKAVPYAYLPQDKGFQIDLQGIKAKITPKTRILILNDLHNPTGADCSKQDLEELARIALEKDLYLLLDEAYFDIRYQGKSLSLASWPGIKERSLILYTFSKRYAMTGWRIGAAIGPKDLIESINRLNVNQESCTNHFVQYAALAGLNGDQREPEEILGILKQRRDTALELLNQIQGINCFQPETTFYLYPEITDLLKDLNLDLEGFRKLILKETGVSFCTRMHFGRPHQKEKRQFIRLAYSGLSRDEIEEGLQKMKEYVHSKIK